MYYVDNDGDVLEITQPVLANYDAVEAIATEKQYRSLVWHTEGAFDIQSGEWKFHDDYAAQGYQPVICDMQTASMLVTIYRAMHSDNQEKMRRMLSASRGQFAKVVNLGWKHVT